MGVKAGRRVIENVGARTQGSQRQVGEPLPFTNIISGTHITEGIERIHTMSNKAVVSLLSCFCHAERVQR